MSRQISQNDEKKDSEDKLNGSKERNVENLVVNTHKENDLISDEPEKEKFHSSIFNIDVMELEGLMGKYKERGADFQDLK